MSTADRPVPARPKSCVELLPYQQADVESAHRLQWSCWARQTGKSFTKSLRRILRGLKRGRTQIFLSAGERQSRELMLKAQQHCHALQAAFDYYDTRFFADTRFKQLEIHLPNRVRIIGLPANPQTMRGFSGDLFLDEFAMHAEDREIWAAIFPTILRGDGELDVASTPKGCKNMFAKLRDHQQFHRSTLTLPDAVAQGLPVDVEELRRSIGDEEIYRQELLCEFVDEATAYLTYENIAACEDPTLEPEPDFDFLSSYKGDLFVGVDIGRKKDRTVIWLVRREADVLITAGWIELDRVPFRMQYERLRSVLRLKCVRRCCVDCGGIGMQLAEEAVEEFGDYRVESVTFTNALKAELAGRLRRRVEDRTIRIPVDERIRNDWHSIERSVTPAGHIRFDADRSTAGHADRFWAAALAVYAAGNAPGKQEQMKLPRLDFARTGIW